MLVGLVSLFFIARTEAQVVLGAILFSAALLFALHASFGYRKLLGLGHLRLGHVEEGLFRTYLIVVVVSYGISLVIDSYDVWTHFSRRG